MIYFLKKLHKHKMRNSIKKFENFNFSYLDELEEIYDKSKKDLEDACLEEIIEIVRERQEDDVFDKFVMGMGTISYSKDDEDLWDFEDEEIEEIINRFDYLKITGNYIKILKDEPLIRD